MTEKPPATASRGMEQDIPATVREAVTARGHRVVAVPAVVAFAPEGTLTGAPCWRAEAPRSG